MPSLFVDRLSCPSSNMSSNDAFAVSNLDVCEVFSFCGLHGNWLELHDLFLFYPLVVVHGNWLELHGLFSFFILWRWFTVIGWNSTTTTLPM